MQSCNLEVYKVIRNSEINVDFLCAASGFLWILNDVRASYIIIVSRSTTLSPSVRQYRTVSSLTRRRPIDKSDSGSFLSKNPDSFRATKLRMT